MNQIHKKYEINTFTGTSHELLLDHAELRFLRVVFDQDETASFPNSEATLYKITRSSRTVKRLTF